MTTIATRFSPGIKLPCSEIRQISLHFDGRRKHFSLLRKRNRGKTITYVKMKRRDRTGKTYGLRKLLYAGDLVLYRPLVIYHLPNLLLTLSLRAAWFRLGLHTRRRPNSDPTPPLSLEDPQTMIFQAFHFPHLSCLPVHSIHLSGHCPAPRLI